MRKLERGQSWKPKDDNQIVCYIAGGSRKIAMLRYLRSEWGSMWGFLYVSSGTYRGMKDLKYASHDATLAISSAINGGREVLELDGFEEIPELIKMHNEQKQQANAPVSDALVSLYNEAPADMQQKMVKIWPQLGSITDRVKTLEELYAISGVNLGMDGDDEWAYRVLKLLARTLNEVYNIVNQFKYLYDIQVDMESKQDVYMAYRSIAYYLEHNIEYSNEPQSTEEEFPFEIISFGDPCYLEDYIYKNKVIS